MLKKGLSLVIVFILCLSSSVSVFASTLICGGDSIGITLSYPGVYITNTYQFIHDGKTIDPKNQDILAGDLICKVNLVTVSSIEQLAKAMQTELEAGNSIQLTLKRNKEELNRQLDVYFDQGSSTFKTGLYVKDQTIGVGTLTYFDPSNHTFASLGHQLNDITYDLSFDEGYICKSKVEDVIKNSSSKTGEKIASLSQNQILGEVVYNDPLGVYGTYDGEIQGQYYETASISEIVKGPAKLLTVLHDDLIEEIDIEIIDLKKQNQPAEKGIYFIVTDESFLNKTNGIIQGMSGSPIIQNGKLIGAVSHVNSKDQRYGYGVYIEWMLEKTETIRQ